MLLPTLPSQNHGKSLAEAIPSARLLGGGDIVATSCTSSSDKVRPGDVFVEMDTEGRGDDAARQAVERGAIAIVCERYLPVFGVTQYVVENSQAAYSEICHALLDHPSASLNAIAIAGSYGKTSIAQLLESIFLVAGKSVGCQTSQYTRIDGCKSRFVLPTTAPGIAEFMDESLASGCRHAVVELSEESLRTRVASAANFDVVCLSNLHGDQPDGNRSPQDSRQAMTSALELLTVGGMVVLNADDQNSMRILSEHEGPTLTFGMNYPADVSATVVDRQTNEQMFFLTIDDDTAAVVTSIVGEAHVQNCLAAASIARVYGVPLRDIALGIEQVKQIPGVMHRFDTGLGVPLYFDRGRSPVAKSGALSAARALTEGQVIAVVDQACSVSGSLADHVISTCGFSKDAVITQAVAKVLAVLEVTDEGVLRTIAAKLSGIAAAVLRAQKGDIVVVCGLGSVSPQENWAAQNVQVPYLVKDLLKELADRLPARSAA